jgi:hypothetical protein
MKEAAEKYEGLRRAHPDLNEALMSVAHGSGGIDARKLGHWLGRKRGRIVSGHKLTSRDDSHSKQMLWYLTPVRQ